MLSIEAPTNRSISANFNCDADGLITHSLLILATRTSEIGPLKGISETANAAEAAKAASASGCAS